MGVLSGAGETGGSSDTSWDDIGVSLPDDLGSDDGGSSATEPAEPATSSSSTSDRYTADTNSDGDYEVPSGYVNAANPDSSGSTDHTDQVQSAQLEEVEEVSGGGNIDSHDVTISDDGSASFGISGGDVDEVQADADGNVIDPGQGQMPINLPSIAGIDISGKMLAIGAVLIGALAYLFGGN